MSADALSRLLHERLGLGPLPLASLQPCAVRGPAGQVLELRLAPDMETLCLAVPLAPLVRHGRAEALVRLMRTNLYLADQGTAHFALAPEDDRVYLCRTVLIDDADLLLAVSEVERLLALADGALEGLRRDQLVDA